MGLQELEASQKRTYAAMVSGGARLHGTADTADPYHASWMDPSPPRLLPHQRVAAAAAAVTLQRQQQQQQRASQPSHNDLTDPLTGQVDPVDTAGCGWRAAYKRAANKQLPRQLRVFFFFFFFFFLVGFV
jgi:hypothetical protein